MKYKLALAKDDKSKAQIFETIQGEASYAGVPAFFIRLQGCNIGCYFCDEKETWLSSKNYIELEAADIVAELRAINPKLKRVVITGGEPCEQDLSSLIKYLRKENFAVHIESSGTGAYLSALFDFPVWVTFSPKEIYAKDKDQAKASELMWKHCSELKFVVSGIESRDYIFETIIPKLEKLGRHGDCPIYLVPDWFDFEANKKLIMEICLEHPDLFKVGIQSHKYLQIL